VIKGFKSGGEMKIYICDFVIQLIFLGGLAMEKTHKMFCFLYDQVRGANDADKALLQELNN